jgi:DNA-binding NtrC family response regulator
MISAKILIVDDEESIRFFLSEAIAKEGYKYRLACNGEDAVKTLEAERFDLAIIDYNMQGMNGIETFIKMREIDPDLVAIMVTAYGNNKLAFEAMEKGVFDYFSKPLDLAELRVVIRRALERCLLQRQVRDLRQDLAEKYNFDQIIGNSRGIRDVIERVRRVAANDVSVLIFGESGTGKELVAQALHFNSPRRDGPFVKVNCAAVPEDLLEAEFFGFEKGSFTGALKRKRGKFEQANAGTLFLDEIGDMPLSTQMKILRVIQESELVRVGGETPIKIDIRIIAATNKDLKKAVIDGEFREDLFFRLNVVSLDLPPLRERREDIAILANHFLKIYNEKFHKNIEGISNEAVGLLSRYSWPGNIRELENVLQRGIVLAYGNILGEKELLDVYPPLGSESQIVDESGDITLEDKIERLVYATEKRLILEALKNANWKRQETADHLGISRKTLHNKMKKYGLEE